MKNPLLIFKPLQVLMLLLILVACSQSESTYKLISPQEFDGKLISLKNVQLVDVRTPEEYQTGHLKNAININFYEEDFKENISRLDKKNPIFIHCAAGAEGARSNQTAELLKELGFIEIYELEGGIINWINSGKETVK
jgi:rhodanese-related sulfurtransferase